MKRSCSFRYCVLLANASIFWASKCECPKEHFCFLGGLQNECPKEPLGGVEGEGEGEHAWAVCRSDVPTNQPFFQQWSEPLRLGYHAAIRKQGNRSRQAKVKEFIQDSIARDTNT